MQFRTSHRQLDSVAGFLKVGKAHLASIYHKLDLDSRVAAIAVAARQGLLGDR
jgi:ATP/maltotriose-dependent transcriptional regulator MalT